MTSAGEEVSESLANGIDPVRESIVASPKKPAAPPQTPGDPKRDPKLIRLNDLIPDSDVTGGRRTVFGSSAPSVPKPRKPKN